MHFVFRTYFNAHVNFLMLSTQPDLGQTRNNPCHSMAIAMLVHYDIYVFHSHSRPKEWPLFNVKLLYMFIGLLLNQPLKTCHTISQHV